MNRLSFSRPARSKFRALTLIEVVIVLLVAAALAGIGYATYNKVVERAQEKSTEASLLHVDDAIATAVALNNEGNSLSHRESEDFETAGYDSDGNNDISSVSTESGVWDLVNIGDTVAGPVDAADSDFRTANEWFQEGFATDTIYYDLSANGAVTGMLKTVIANPGEPGNWHLSFTKVSGGNRAVWSGWCPITPQDLKGTSSPADEAWPHEDCAFDGDFTIDTDGGVDSVAAELSAPTAGLESVTVEYGHSANADSVQLALYAFTDAAGTDQHLVDGEQLVYESPATLNNPTEGSSSSFTFQNAQPGLYYQVQSRPMIGQQPSGSFELSDELVQPYTYPNQPDVTLTVDQNCVGVPCDSTFDPQINVTWPAIADNSADAGYREVFEYTVFFREAGASEWMNLPSQAAMDVDAVLTGLAPNTSYDVKVATTSTVLTSTGDVIGTVDIGAMPSEDPSITAVLTPALEPTVRWTADLADDADAIMYRTDKDGDGTWSEWSTIDTNLNVMVTTEQYVDAKIEVAACTDFGCRTSAHTQEVLGVEDAAVPAAPAVPVETKQANPDVTYTFSAPEHHQYRIQHQIAGGGWSDWSPDTSYKIVGVGQYTEVCARLSARKQNDYGFGAWSPEGNSTCHTTGGQNPPPTFAMSTSVTSQEEAGGSPMVKFNWSNPGGWATLEASHNGGAWKPLNPTATSSGWLPAAHFTNPTYQIRVAIRSADNEYGPGSLSAPAVSNTAKEPVGGPPQSCAAPGTISVSSQEEQDLTPRVYFSWTDRNPNSNQQYSYNGGGWTNTSIHSTNSGWLNASHGTTPTWRVRARNICSNDYGSKHSSWRYSNTDSEPVGRPVAKPGTPASISLWSAESPSATPHVRWDWTDRNPTHQQIYRSWCNCWADYNNTYTGYGWERHAQNQTLGFQVRNRYGAQGNNYNRTSPSGSAPYLWGDWRYSNYDTETTGGVPNVSMWRQSGIGFNTSSYHQATISVDWGTTDHSGGKRAPTTDSWQLLNTSWQVVASGTSSVGGSGSWIGAAPNTQYLARVQSCNSYGCSGWKSEWWTYTQPRTPYQTSTGTFDWIGQCDSVSYETSHGSIGSHNVHVPMGWGWAFWKDFGHGDHHHVNGVPIFVHNYGRSGKTSICNNNNGSFWTDVYVSMGGIYSQSDQGRFNLSR